MKINQFLKKNQIMYITFETKIFNFPLTLSLKIIRNDKISFQKWGTSPKIWHSLMIIRQAAPATITNACKVSV